jgi:hypothetical protein
MLFRIVRKVLCGSLSIKITFEQSDEPPCELMIEHAEEVEETVRELYADTDKTATLVAMEIVDKFRRVSSVRVEDEDTGEYVICEYERGNS